MHKKEKIIRVSPKYPIRVWCDGKVVIFKNEQNQPICSECFNDYRKITIRSDRYISYEGV